MIRELSKKEYPSVVELGKIIKKDFNIKDIGPNDKVVGYFIKNKLIAFLEYSKLYEVIDILNIITKDEYRRKGIATKLINYLSNIVETNTIMLEVRKSNTSAINLYKKNGFEVVREIKNYYNDEDALSMRKEC